jgi:glutathione S-transferase
MRSHLLMRLIASDDAEILAWLHARFRNWWRDGDRAACADACIVAWLPAVARRRGMIGARRGCVGRARVWVTYFKRCCIDLGRAAGASSRRQTFA